MIDASLTTLDSVPRTAPTLDLNWNDVFNKSTSNTEATISDKTHIKWAASLKDAIAEGRSSGKPVVCVFEENYCGWCKQLDQELSKPAVDQLGDSAIFVKIRPSTDASGQALASSLGIDAYPTVSILDIKGANISERSRATGFMTADQFAQRVRPTGDTVLV